MEGKDLNRLKVVLAEKKRTNKWLAEQIGVDQATVSKWCTNNGKVPEEEGWVDVSGNGFTPNPKKYFAVHAKGNSMQPKIQDGDICVFEWYRAGSRNGEIVLTECNEKDVEYGGMYTIKKYHSEKLVTEEGWQHNKVELVPLNKNYDTIELDGETEYRTIGVLKCVL